MADGLLGDALAVSLDDPELRGELELLIEVFLAVNDSDGPLSIDEIDELLGVTPVWIHPQRQPEDPPALRVVRPGSLARSRATSPLRPSAGRATLAT
jgi:hypothetical protein